MSVSILQDTAPPAILPFFARVLTTKVSISCSRENVCSAAWNARRSVSDVSSASSMRVVLTEASQCCPGHSIWTTQVGLLSVSVSGGGSRQSRPSLRFGPMPAERTLQTFAWLVPTTASGPNRTLVVVAASGSSEPILRYAALSMKVLYSCLIGRRLAKCLESPFSTKLGCGDTVSGKPIYVRPETVWCPFLI